jgi:hypothetical protein
MSAEYVANYWWVVNEHVVVLILSISKFVIMMIIHVAVKKGIISAFWQLQSKVVGGSGILAYSITLNFIIIIVIVFSTITHTQSHLIISLI